MISDLFVNACILVSIIFMTVEFLEQDKIKYLSSNKKSIISGICFSILSIFLMKFSIYITPYAFVDFRSIAQSASAYYAGPISSIITGLISSLFRIFYFGINDNSLVTFTSMITSSILCAYISKKNFDKKTKWILMVMFSTLNHSLLFALVLDDRSDTFKAISYLSVGTLFISIIVYCVLKNLLIAHKQIEKLKIQASIDFLTGVNNTRNFNLLYNQHLKKFKEEDMVFSVLMLDIDFFKKTNDTYGHLAGDKVLKDLGFILNMFCREDAIIGRVGGEEFCILLENYTKEDVLKFAEKLRQYIDKNIITLNSKVQIHVTVSIGLATYKETVFDIENVRDFADQKLYECKKTGRNKVCF